MTDLKITILGCGNSTGVPAIGNYWGACDPNEPKNARTRSSLAIQSEDTTLIIDTGPDFRQQMNAADISELDAVLYTHMHGDHVNGIDELRVYKFRQDKLVDVYFDKDSYDDVRTRFHYMFDGGKIDLYPPMLNPHVFKNEEYGQGHTIKSLEFIPFLQDHGTCETVGYRIGSFAYSLDMLTLDDAALEVLKGIRVWVVDAAAYNQDSNKVHANLETIYRLNEKIGAERVILSSLSLSMDYQTLVNELPDGYEPAYDGLTFEVQG